MNQKLHPYTLSLLVNLKWLIKRISSLSILDRKIGLFLVQKFPVTKVCLNLGCGAWTPYDSILKDKSKSMINLDATAIALFFHPITGKKIIVNDENIYKIINEYKVTSIVSFHSLPFIHINLPKLLHFCKENGITFSADLSFQKKSNDISPFFFEDQRSFLIEALEKTNSLIYDVSTDDDYKPVHVNQIAAIGRYLIHIE